MLNVFVRLCCDLLCGVARIVFLFVVHCVTVSELFVCGCFVLVRVDVCPL